MSLSTPVSQVSDLTIRELLIVLDNVSPIADLMLHDPLVGKSAWVRRSLDPGDCLMPIPVACLAELDTVLHEIRANLCPAIFYTPDQFDLPACRTFLAQAMAMLDDGVRFALADRLPVKSMSKEEGKPLFWLLSSLITVA